MSFDVKNIEQENIDIKKIIPVVILFIFSIVGSMVFVYYYFSFEKNAIMQEQYLGAESQINASYEEKELYGDSKCCSAKILPAKVVLTDQVEPEHSLLSAWTKQMMQGRTHSSL